MQFVDPTDQRVGGPFLPTFRWLHEHRFVIVAVLFLFDASARGVLWVARKVRKLNTEALSKVLDALVYEVFPGRDAQKHHYRATLFKVRRFCRYGSWLGIVARSGHTFTRRVTIFSIDPNKLASNTGFAGECWRQGGTLISTDALSDMGAKTVADQEVEDYKSLGWLADIEYDRMSVKSRVFMATCIRVGGQPWGVLVLDSTDSSVQPKNTAKQQAILNVAAVAVSQLVS
jgi:hypothetical protein